MNWQPIDTAPRDGTRVDLWVGDLVDGERVTDCFWGFRHHVCQDSYCDSSAHEDMHIEGWREPLGEELIGTFYKPTHWMPLPEPPATISEDSGHATPTAGASPEQMGERK